MNWSRFTPKDFQYDFERDDLAAHRVTFEEECCPDHYGMAIMKKRARRKTEREIDELVIAKADDDSAWENPVRVQQPKNEAVSIPAEVALRAAFFARLHRESSVEAWIKKIVAERVDIEEAAFAEAKRDLTAQ